MEFLRGKKWSKFGLPDFLFPAFKEQFSIIRPIVIASFLVLNTADLSLASITKPKKPERHLRVQLSGDGFKPWHQSASASVRRTFNSAIHVQLLYFDADYNISPGFIKKWRWDYKRNLFIVEIDDNTVCHNGQKLKAIDFEFALAKPFLSVTEDRWEQGPLKIIKGIDKLKKGQKFRPGLIDGIKVVNNNKLEISLTSPNPSFLHSLGEVMPPLAPMNSFKDDLYSYHDDLPIGCGEYKVVYSDQDSPLVRVERFKNDDNRVPFSIDFFNNGTAMANKVDLAIASGGRGLSKEKKYRSIVSPITKSIMSIDFNFDSQLGGNLEFRKLIASLANRSEMTEGVKYWVPNDQVIPNNFYGRLKYVDSYDLNKAKDYIARNPKFVERKWKAFYHGPKERLPYHIRVLKKDFLRVGLNIEFIPTNQTKFESKDSDVLFFVYGKSTVFTDPMVPFSYFTSEDFLEFQSVKNDKEFLRLYKLAQKQQSIENKTIHLKALSSHIKNNLNTLPLFDSKQRYYLGDRVQSIGIEKLFSSFNFDLVEFRTNDN
ncbi:MAG: hypothetical protein HRU19_23820 [Pseudobacteriovorax sp.]|nr:hypothetical protein [Pseudobacteriovorax sp.]